MRRTLPDIRGQRQIDLQDKQVIHQSPGNHQVHVQIVRKPERHPHLGIKQPDEAVNQIHDDNDVRDDNGQQKPEVTRRIVQHVQFDAPARPVEQMVEVVDHDGKIPLGPPLPLLQVHAELFGLLLIRLRLGRQRDKLPPR
ncbi:hypothetical protein D1872_249480 [compost metagenome]